MTRAWTRSCAACSVRKGLIFWCCVMQTCNIKRFLQCGPWKSAGHQRLHPRFLTELDGVIVDEPSWMVKSCYRVGVAGKTRSSVFARLSCRWCFFHPCQYVCQAAWASVQLPLDHLVEIKDRAVCHKNNKGKRNQVPVWWIAVILKG